VKEATVQGENRLNRAEEMREISQIKGCKARDAKSHKFSPPKKKLIANHLQYLSH
jgi:hypothetical protein